MTFDIDINGRTHRVAVEAVGAASAAGGSFRVLLDGAPIELSARVTDLGLSLVFAGDRRSVDVAISPSTTSGQAASTGSGQASGEWLVQLPHVDMTAAVDARRRERARTGDAGAEGEQRLKAPMPGRVIRVLVKAGDTVDARQPLIVIEAMKMENELVAAKAGRVKEIAVAEGNSVQSGGLLMVIE